MSFQKVNIENLRNLSEVEFTPEKGINFIVGKNGSGKTTLLEAVYLLARGRSFRDIKLSRSIARGKESLRIFGKGIQQQRTLGIGISVNRSGLEIRLNGIRVRRLSDLAREFPLQLITPRSHEIMEKGAHNRRRFVEWGVFHVEPSYQQFSSRYQKALSQRNAALKQNARLADAWTEALVTNGTVINQLREQYVRLFKENLTSYLESLIGQKRVELHWRQGWSQQRSLQQSLEDGLESDLKRGFTQAGPHRADLQVTIENEPVHRWASRGQQKLVIVSMFLAQAMLIRQQTDRDPILLLDDVGAELDETNRNRVFQKIRSEGCQTLVTATDMDLANKTGYEGLFHVEHGEIHQQHV